jgi:hypothetical protein
MFTGPNIVTDGLVLHLDAGNTKSYPGSGTTWFDKSGNENNGTLVNGPTYSSTNGGSIVFDGSNDYATTTLTDVNFDSSGFTLGQFIMLLNEPGAWRTTFNIKNYANNRHIDIRNNGLGNMVMNYYPLGIDVTAGSYNIIENIWYQLVGTWDGANLKLYVNGVERGTTPLTSIAIGTSPILTIGRAYDGSRYVNDRFANINVYNRALSTAEVLQNYNATKARFNL